MQDLDAVDVDGGETPDEVAQVARALALHISYQPGDEESAAPVDDSSAGGSANAASVAEFRDAVAIEDDGLTRYACAALDVDDGDVPDDDGRARHLSRSYRVPTEKGTRKTHMATGRLTVPFKGPADTFEYR